MIVIKRKWWKNCFFNFLPSHSTPLPRPNLYKETLKSHSVNAYLHAGYVFSMTHLNVTLRFQYDYTKHYLLWTDLTGMNLVIKSVSTLLLLVYELGFNNLPVSFTKDKFCLFNHDNLVKDRWTYYTLLPRATFWSQYTLFFLNQTCSCWTQHAVCLLFSTCWL